MPTTACTTTTGNCVVQSNSSLLNGNVTLSANTQIHVVGGTWEIKNQTVNLSPGTYWVSDGDLKLGANGILECTACNIGTVLAVIIHVGAVVIISHDWHLLSLVAAGGTDGL